MHYCTEILISVQFCQNSDIVFVGIFGNGYFGKTIITRRLWSLNNFLVFIITSAVYLSCLYKTEIDDNVFHRL